MEKLFDEIDAALKSLSAGGYKNDGGVLLTNDRDLHKLGENLATVKRRVALMTANPATNKPVS